MVLLYVIKHLRAVPYFPVIQRKSIGAFLIQQLSKGTGVSERKALKIQLLPDVPLVHAGISAPYTTRSAVPGRSAMATDLTGAGSLRLIAGYSFRTSCLNADDADEQRYGFNDQPHGLE